MSHSLPYEVNCSILFTELPLLERPAAAKAAGFDAVEYLVAVRGGRTQRRRCGRLRQRDPGRWGVAGRVELLRR